MGRKVLPGRYTASSKEPFVVLLIGMRVNRIFAIRKWWPTSRAMVRCLSALRDHPEKGFLSAELILYGRGIGLIQYWRSFDDMERFAREPSEPHLDVWKQFNRAIGADGTVGFWHESYLVDPTKFECVYGNMPVFGVARATEHLPAEGRRETARARLGGHSEPAVPSPTQPDS